VLNLLALLLWSGSPTGAAPSTPVVADPADTTYDPQRALALRLLTAKGFAGTLRRVPDTAPTRNRLTDQLTDPGHTDYPIIAAVFPGTGDGVTSGRQVLIAGLDLDVTPGPGDWVLGVEGRNWRVVDTRTLNPDDAGPILHRCTLEGSAGEPILASVTYAPQTALALRLVQAKGLSVTLRHYPDAAPVRTTRLTDQVTDPLYTDYSIKGVVLPGAEAGDSPQESRRRLLVAGASCPVNIKYGDEVFGIGNDTWKVARSKPLGPDNRRPVLFSVELEK
jgi:hypothetical protein